MNNVLRCPSDGEPLLERTHGASHYHQCTGCHGIWVSRTFLLGLARAESKRAKVIDYPEPIHFADTASCPACEQEMIHRIESKIQIDLCPKCRHLWLDGGEILHIAAALDAKSKKAAEESSSPQHYLSQDLRTAGIGSAADVAIDLAIRAASEILPDSW